MAGTATGGFQGSEHTGVEVTVYSHTDDPILFQTGTAEMRGRTEADKYPSIVAVTTSKAMGSAGTFTVTLKGPSQSNVYRVMDAIADDDWVDIVFFKHGEPHHVMRGLVDDVRRSRTVGGTGATQTTYTITGKCFQKVWESTQMWFDRATAENLGGGLEYRVVGVPLNKPPLEVVEAYLYGFLQELANLGRANWELPPTIPGVSGTILDALSITGEDNPYGSALNRRSVNPNFSQAGGNLWDLATEWCDPMFCELFTDLRSVPNEKYGEMAIYYRIKPFPNLALAPSGLDAPFYTVIPKYIVPRQQIVSDDLGRSGAERFNAFVVGMQTQQEWAASQVELTRPLWNPSDMLRHGKRTFDVNTKYVAENNDLMGMSSAMRELVRDWYAINPYLLSGTMELGVGRPDIRVGGRLVIPGQTEESQETYYVESVSHSWSLPRGMHTSLGLTRGYIGSDASHISALQILKDQYSVPPVVSAVEDTALV